MRVHKSSLFGQVNGFHRRIGMIIIEVVTWM